MELSFDHLETPALTKAQLAEMLFEQNWSEQARVQGDGRRRV